MSFAPRAIFASLLVCSVGCSGLSHGVYTEGHTRYRIGELPASWQLLRMSQNDVAYISRDSPHSLAINATCENHDDPPLEVLTRHLLMGFTARETVTQTRVVLDGREALRTHALARLDGVAVELVLVVMKKDGCVYDFTYLSPVGRLEERRAAFEQVLERFKTGAAS